MRSLAVAFVALAASLALAAPAFESATLKPVGVNHEPRTAAFGFDGTFTARNASLSVLIVTAFRGVWPPQEIPALQVTGGPDWLGLEGFDVEARAAGNAPRSQMQEMLKTLLAERFALKVHRETRQLPIYRIVMARKDRRLGAGLKPTLGPCVNTAAGSAADPSGLPRCGDRFGPSRLRSRRLSLVGMTIDQFAAALAGTNFVGGPVLNQTDLDGIFDVDLEFTTGIHTDLTAFGTRDSAPMPDDDPLQLSIFDAMEQQLGLKLESVRKAPVDVIVVDHASRPAS